MKLEELEPAAVELLVEAFQDDDELLVLRMTQGMLMRTRRGRAFETQDHVRAFYDLEEIGLLRYVTGDLYRLTREGRKLAKEALQRGLGGAVDQEKAKGAEPMAKPVRDQVFVSYAHVDQSEPNWLEKLKLHCGLFSRQGAVDIWEDTRIATGHEWREQIRAAIDRAKVGVLLVGPGFLRSDFIAKEELAPLLEAADRGEVTILPLVIAHCAYTRSELERYQAFNDPENPLEALPLAEQNRILKEFSVAIEEAVNPP